MKNAIRIMAGAAAVAMLLASCWAGGGKGGGSSSGKNELTFAHYYVDEERETSAEMNSYLTLVENWEKEHPDITLTQSVMAQADYATKIQAQAAVNEVPDLFFLKGSWVSNFVDNEIPAPINDYLDKYEDKDKFREGVFDAATRDGKIYGIPNQLSITSVVYYNEALWKEAGYESFPDNWDDILKAADYFNGKGIAAIGLGNKDKWPSESCLLSTMGDHFTGTAWTESFIDNDGKSKFTDGDFVSALEMLQKLAKGNVFNKDVNTITETQASEYYVQGKAASIVTGHWTLNYLLTSAPDNVLGNTKVAILPQAEGGKGEANQISGGCGWYVSVNNSLEGDKKDLAMDLLFSATGYELSKYYAENYGMSNACEVENVDMSGFPQLTQDFSSLIQSVSFTPIYDMQMDGAVIEVMNTGLQELINDTKSPKDLAEQIQSEQDKLK